MKEFKAIEEKLGYALPKSYVLFLSDEDVSKYLGKEFRKTDRDGYKTLDTIDKFVTPNTFWDVNQNRDYLFEFVDAFELNEDYVEAENLYHIAFSLGGSICMALNGKHKGLIYHVDNGDEGIVYQNDSISEFINSLFDSSKFRCNEEGLIEAVKSNDLLKLAQLIENQDGDKLIQNSSWLDIELFDLAFNGGKDDILNYLIKSGYRGYNRMNQYNLEK